MNANTPPLPTADLAVTAADLPITVALHGRDPDEPERRYILRHTRAGKLLLVRDESAPQERPRLRLRPPHAR